MLKYLTSNTSFLPIIQIVLTCLILIYAFLVPQTVTLWAISVLGYAIIGCFGISIGYHRLLTHRSFSTSKFWERTCTALGALAFTGSSIGWVGVHRDHHRYSDHDGDPHSPVQYGWRMLIAKYGFEPNKWAVRGLITDPFHAFLHKYYFGILIAWALLVGLILGPLALMHVVLIPGCISIWSSTISNYMNHKWGYSNFTTRDESKNNLLNAIFTFGEGWHNNHHANPRNWNFKHRWWELDLGAQVIKLIKK